MKQIKKPYFSLEFKQDATQLILSKGYSYAEASTSLGVSISALRKWVRAEKGASKEGNHLSTAQLSLSEREELLGLRKENVRLKMERMSPYTSRQTYGSRRLVKALELEGYNEGRFKVRRLMKQLKLAVRYPKRVRVTTDSHHALEVTPNTLNRQFNPTAPNKVWTTDISYVWTLEGWMYIAVVIDLYSRQVVGWAIDEHMKTSLCIDALQMAYWRKKPAQGLMHRSDRGSQYASHCYREQLKIMGMRQSMSRKGNCWDNSPTERFFRSLKSEHLNYQRLCSQAMARLSIVDYIAFYNGQRIHSTLGYQSPMAFEEAFYRRTA